MTRITLEYIEAALGCMESMDLKTLHRTKKRLLRTQPDMHSAITMLKQQGASKNDVENLLATLTVVLMAMEKSALPWPRITFNIMSDGYDRLIGLLIEGGRLPPSQAEAFRSQWVRNHAEKIVMDSVLRTMANYPYTGKPSFAPNFAVMTMNIAESIAIAAKTFQKPRRSPAGAGRHSVRDRTFHL